MRFLSNGPVQARYGNSDCRRVCHAIEYLSWPGSVIGLTRRPLKAETTGSIPVRATKIVIHHGLGRIGMGYEVFPIKPKCLHSNDLPKFVLQFRSCEDQRLNPCL